MDDTKQILSNNLQSQWQDHFHMRDQTWKVLQYSIFFFLGVIGLEYKFYNDYNLMVIAYLAVIISCLFGIIIAVHHRQRQKEKFQIICKLEEELQIDKYIKSITGKSKETFAGRIDTSKYIILIQIAIGLLAFILLFQKIKLF